MLYMTAVRQRLISASLCTWRHAFLPFSSPQPLAKYKRGDVIPKNNDNNIHSNEGING